MWCLSIPYLPIITSHSVHNIDIRNPLAHSAPCMLSAICLLQFTQTHLWKEHFSKEPVTDTITEEVSICAFKVTYDDKLQSGQDPQWGERANRQNSLKWFPVEAKYCVSCPHGLRLPHMRRSKLGDRRCVHFVCQSLCSNVVDGVGWWNVKHYGHHLWWTSREPSWRLHGGGGWGGQRYFFMN